MAKWIVAFSKVMRIHFQPEVTLEDELKDVLTPEELQILKESGHRSDHNPHSQPHVHSCLVLIPRLSASVLQAGQGNTGHVTDHPKRGRASNSPAADEPEPDDFRGYPWGLREALEGTHPRLIHQV